MKSKTIVIMNRASCRKMPRGSMRNIMRLLKKQISPHKIVLTLNEEDASKIVKSSAAYDTIIGLGGDGTIAGIINNMNLKKQVLGIIPMGTGNSIARHLKLKSINDAIAALKKNNASFVDLIKCDIREKGRAFSRYVLSTCGLGFIERSSKLANRYFKHLGAFCYPVSAFCASFRLKTIRADIMINDLNRRTIDFTTLLLNNTSYSGNICVFPHADITDSRFHLLIGRGGVIKHIASIWGLFALKIRYLPARIEEIQNLNICLTEPAELMLDGEIFGPVDEVNFCVKPAALKILRTAKF